jgi:hypothetical protein
MRRLNRNQIEEFMEDSMSEITVAKNELDKANEELRAAQAKANAAAQSLHKAYDAQEQPQAAEVQHPGKANLKIDNDYMQAPGRWNGPNTDIRARKPLTPAELDELRANSATKSQPTFAEKAKAAEAAGVVLKPPVTIMGTRGTVKVQ